MPMPPDEARTYVLTLFQCLLKRQPREPELDHWAAHAERIARPEDVLYAFLKSKEYVERNRVATLFPPGHYFSPVVDPDTVHDYVAQEHTLLPHEIAGIEISLEPMEAFWLRQQDLIRATPFCEAPDGRHRYHYTRAFPQGDAMALRAMLADLRPANLIEIGAGYSSACMLDTADEFGLPTQFTFIDPNTARLESLLREADAARVRIIRSGAQRLPLELFGALGAGDVLMIDSTHVMKTGSDVHFELFRVLPILKRGVVVHVHDVHYPFEYPGWWIFELNRSWNEIYALRAFLMYNDTFRIRFWGTCLAQLRRDLVERTQPQFLHNPGSGIWLEKVR